MIEVAQAYGWTNFVHVSDYCTTHPTVDPFAEARTRRSSHAAVANLAVPAPLVSQEKPPSTKVRVKKNLAAAHTHTHTLILTLNTGSNKRCFKSNRPESRTTLRLLL